MARIGGLTGLLATFLLSMAGIPPLAGFAAKLQVFSAAVGAGRTWLVLVGVLASVAAAFIAFTFPATLREVADGVPDIAGVSFLQAVAIEAVAENAQDTPPQRKGALDVLAQQLVAIVGVETWDADALYALVRRAAPYADLSRGMFDGVLDTPTYRFVRGQESRSAGPTTSPGCTLRPSPWTVQRLMSFAFR